MPSLRFRYGVPVGLSDHSLGVEIAIGAMTLGAAMVEKHFTLDRNLPGGDNEMSCLPAELKLLAQAAGRLPQALGASEKIPVAGEASMQTLIRRSIFAARDIPSGAVLTAQDLVCKRPGTGLAPKNLDRLIGRKTSTTIFENDMISEDMVY